MNDRGQASAWLQAWAHLIPNPGTVLDVACGRGRNARWLAERGNTVIGVDRDPEAVAAVAEEASALLAPNCLAWANTSATACFTSSISCQILGSVTCIMFCLPEKTVLSLS